MDEDQVYEKVRSGEWTLQQFKDWCDDESNKAYTRGQDNQTESDYM